MSDLHISWDEYRSKTEDLAKQIHKDGWQFNQVVCIAKGGMRVGDVMARIFDVPLAILSVESYKGDGVKNKRGAITFSRDLAKTSPNIGSKVLEALSSLSLINFLVIKIFFIKFFIN